ncbi:hypothetical protein GCM10011331_08870 [Flavimobilis marinus]|nr:hypothetical protein GCM10011331_08870 [Flavimobilis marinus]
MRAGDYAFYQGEFYSASFAGDTSVVLLYAPDGTSPEGFLPDLSGRLRKKVQRQEVTRLQSVETWAVWQGRRVEVVKVAGGRASVQQWQWPVPDHPAARAIENGLWGAKVPIEELTEVVETVTEVPIAL